jgi:S-formylglutathione hydrolase FrmB
MKQLLVWIGALAMVVALGAQDAATELRFNTWNPTGAANWKETDGVIEATTGTGLLVSKERYRDFEMHVEFWADDPANSGVFLRCSNPADITQDTAYEVNIYDNRPDQTGATGAIVGVSPSSQPMKAAGKWNTFDIVAQGTHLVVTMNGVKTVDTNDTKYAEGPIALQHAAGTIRFRNVRIRPLPAAAPKGKGKGKGNAGLIRPLADVQRDLEARLEKITVHGAALEGNLEGDSPDRDVFVYLPPSYTRETSRRYPVAYMLHGYGLHATQWVGFINVAAADKHAVEKEMIVVMPDAFTLQDGSFYSNSKTTGDWERFIAVDLVKYVDSHYRTKANRLSRGLGGHSMGGYGTFRIGMKYPDVFGSLYSMSAGGVFEPGEAPPSNNNSKSSLARSAAWSPNPQDWKAHSVLSLVAKDGKQLKKMKAIAMDVGLQDNLVSSNRDLDKALTDMAIAHNFETYEGDHNGKVPERFDTKVLPFFAKNLE